MLVRIISRYDVAIQNNILKIKNHVKKMHLIKVILLKIYFYMSYEKIDTFSDHVAYLVIKFLGEIYKLLKYPYNY